MKKIFLIITGICLGLCCIGCSSNSMMNHTTDNGTVGNWSANIDSVFVGNDNLNSSHTEDVTHDVPHVLVFDSFEQVSKLKDMIDEDEDHVIDYLNSQNYSMNGMTSKNDIIELFSNIGDVSMLHLDSASGYELVDISYYVSYDYIMSTYKKDSDIVRFICYIDPIDDTVTSNSSNNLESEIVSSFHIQDQTIGLHNVAVENSPYSLTGSIETSNSLITILLSENDENMISNTIGDQIISSTLLDLIGK